MQIWEEEQKERKIKIKGIEAKESEKLKNPEIPDKFVQQTPVRKFSQNEGIQPNILLRETDSSPKETKPKLAKIKITQPPTQPETPHYNPYSWDLVPKWVQQREEKKLEIPQQARGRNPKNSWPRE
eukprot:TRINITY_DN4718_c0_g2_i2.p1 TRINITY_DN4718_c0_g2~~TRINITY_DN4718_c0_g2_i2.p1  ORF type:complete len:126 (+),score=43.24 TRINITY_DN4718_c0_g2_i2:532-909(+)